MRAAGSRWRASLAASEDPEPKLIPKNIRYETADRSVQKALDETRAAEWDKYVRFGAAVPVRGEELRKLLDQKHVPIPTNMSIKGG